MIVNNDVFISCKRRDASFFFDIFPAEREC